MYIPPFNSILRALGLDRASYDHSEKVSVPKELFEFLIKQALEHADFNEAGYLKENPDVADAVRKGQVEDARHHYNGFGYFEGRTGGTPTVNERWYLATYTDVATAVRQGKVASAGEHYNVIGAAEGRSPSAEYAPIAEKWKKVFSATL